MLTERQPFYVFEHEIFRLQFGHYADIVKNELVSWIVKSTLADKGEPLTWCTTKHYVDFGIANIGFAANVVAGNIDHACTDRFRVWEIVFVNSAVNWVDFHSGGDIESGLFETQRQSAGSCEEVDTDRASFSRAR